MFNEWLQSGGVIATIVAGLVGYGRLHQKVENQKEEADSYVKEGSFEAFQDEVLRRLKRIEQKQDRHFNGR